ncbi:hypothetical protein B0T26DRAFT_703901 [Lasiosphaeria miniovina]|uniref:Secreted protein n=1 Tax=Lasiosphaeria miniovina TaxID=1954250 RepID=A0AA40E2Q1_9PEZI|nr:uncharacterized protein B0T26DRAFT_703901 [Lasiosphaeria miniovina]KAK0722767.1 hypothetical protein B0T26DRAFT_703901 [Lasiosphaeria miniovina]
MGTISRPRTNFGCALVRLLNCIAARPGVALQQAPWTTGRVAGFEYHVQFFWATFGNMTTMFCWCGEHAQQSAASKPRVWIRVLVSVKSGIMVGDATLFHSIFHPLTNLRNK